MEYENQLKGIRVPEYYLGGDMELDKDGKMSWLAKTYIKNVTEGIEKLLETCLRSWDSPIVEEYHPELDTSPFWKDLKSPKPDADWLLELDCHLR